MQLLFLTNHLEKIIAYSGLYREVGQVLAIEKIESLYYRAAQSEDATIREQAQACLISKLMGKQDYEQGQKTPLAAC